MATPLETKLLNGLRLGLEGDHQNINAGLAVALCYIWLRMNGHSEYAHLKQMVSSKCEKFFYDLFFVSIFCFCHAAEVTHVCMKQRTLPEQFIKGLATASLQGRAHIVPDQFINKEISSELVFFLDGAHSPESMQACARWFSHAIKDQDQTLINQKPDNSKIEMKTHLDETAQKKSAQVEQLAVVKLEKLAVKVGYLRMI